MASISSVITGGFGVPGSASLVITDGYGTAGVTPPPAPSSSVGGVRRGFLRRSYKAPILPWERIPDEPVVIAKPARKRIRMPAVEAIRKATDGAIPIETVREIAAPVISIPEIGAAVLADIDDDEDLIWLI